MKSKYVCIGLAFFFAILFQHTSLAAELNDDSHLYIESIECRGNSAVSCDFIRHKLHLPLNTKIADAEVQNAKLRLSALPNFKSVDLKLEKGSQKGKTILVVEVVEASSLLSDVSAGVGYASLTLPDTSIDYEPFLTETISGRLSYQNLFDAQKIIELKVLDTHTSQKDTADSILSSSLTYIDPNLFGFDRLFMSLNVNQLEDHYHSSSETVFSETEPTLTVRRDEISRDTVVDALIGYRLWTYSYAYASYRREFEHYRSQLTIADSSTGLVSYSDSYDSRQQDHLTRIGYGWDSEDDPYFPTRGSVFAAVVDWSPTLITHCCDSYSWLTAYKKNWLLTQHSVLTLNVGGEPGGIGDRVRPIGTEMTPYGGEAVANPGTLGLRYAHLLRTNNGLGESHRSRWYVQLDAGPFELSRHGRVGGHPESAVLTVGMRFESKLFGVVDLYATGSKYWIRSFNVQ